MPELFHASESATRANTRGINKPNEDYIIRDRERDIFIVLDGVTRPHEEYAAGRENSVALEVSKIFGDALHAHLVANLQGAAENMEALIAQAAAHANDKVREHNRRETREKWTYYPGTVGVVGVIKGGILYYGYIGDGLGLLIRNGTKIFFTEQQTRHFPNIENQTKEFLYANICNHKEARFSYGVITGEKTAMDFFQTCHVALEPNDLVILSTDGAAEYLIHEPAPNILQRNPAQILEASVEYDAPPFARYSDDKAIITISIADEQPPLLINKRFAQ